MIRKANVNDVDLILYFIKELAKYEKMLDLVTATPELIKEWIFEKKKAEDLFVLPEYRGKGYGLELVNELRDICKKEKLGRFEWQCINWNKPSIEFYEKLGAKQHNQWLIFRIDENQF